MKADLADLNAFLAVAQARGFRDASRTVGSSASTLSEAVRRLETRLGVRLLHRTTRSVVPTEAGMRLLERLAPALGEVEAALDIVNLFRDRPAGTLKLNVPVSAARLVLPGILPGFLAAYPDIEVEIVAEDGFVDMVASGCDAGIRYDERLEQDMIAVPIGPRIQRFATAASPAYLDARGRPNHPRDLLDHACLRGRFTSGALTSPWEFERTSEILRIEPRGPLIASVSGAADLLVDFAIAGGGIIHLFRTGCGRRWPVACWNRCCLTGGNPSPARSSITPAAGWCRRRYAPSWISFEASFLLSAGSPRRDRTKVPLRHIIVRLEW